MWCTTQARSVSHIVRAPRVVWSVTTVLCVCVCVGGSASADGSMQVQESNTPAPVSSIQGGFVSV